jgi:hypothetical protein
VMTLESPLTLETKSQGRETQNAIP